jgi:hypothetical protein
MNNLKSENDINKEATIDIHTNDNDNKSHIERQNRILNNSKLI